MVHDITEATRWACRYMDRPFMASLDSPHGLENGRAGRANADGLVFLTRGNRVGLVAVTVAVSSAHPVLPLTGRLLVLCERLMRQQAGAAPILAA